MSDEYLQSQDNQDYGVEPEVIAQFSDESEELLDGATNLFIRLEENPSDEEAIHKVFRIVHTIKGNSAFFNLLKVKALAHVMEDLMNLIRRGSLSVTRTIIDVLIEGIDYLKFMLNRVRNLEPEVPDENALRTLIDRIKQQMEQKGEALNLAAWQSILHDLNRLNDLIPSDETDLQKIITQLTDRVHQVAPKQAEEEQAQDESAEAAASCGLLDEIRSILTAGDEISGEKSKTLHKMLKDLKVKTVNNTGTLIDEILEVYNSVIDQTGFNSFLRDFILEKLGGVQVSSGETVPADVPPEVEDIREILSVDSDFLDEASASRMIELFGKLKGKTTPDTLPAVEEAIEVYNSVMQTTGFTPFLHDFLLEKLDCLTYSVSPAPVQAKETPEPQKAPQQDAQSASEKPQQQAMGKTMRIAESDIDNFLDFVGELVVIGEMFSHVHQRLTVETSGSRNVVELKKSIEMFNKLSDNLRQSILDVRKVPVKQLLTKAPKTVRDIARAKDKKIRVETEGDEIRIDKSLLETLDGPFSHLLRNSADHGVETPEERVKAGKPEEGVVRIRVSEDEADLILEIIDDGAGIDPEKIRKKVLENELLPRQKLDEMSENEIQTLVFLPGFSTAKEVTDVSGRGVGMDVVRRAIEGSGGRVTLTSEIGRGTVFKLALPKTVTVKIILGFLIGLGGDKYVLPMDNVGETFRVTPDMISMVAGKGEAILHHGNVIPIRKLAGIFYDDWSSKEGIGVIIRNSRQRFILLVDDVHGTRKVVIKDIEGMRFSEVIAGGAILGNEEVAIVLDPEKL